MKKFTLILTLCATLTSAADDRRMVNGVVVDLTPLQTWLLKPKGERPLTHWRQIEIVGVIGTVAAMERCLISDRVEHGEILIKLPAEISQYFQAKAARTEAMRALRAQIAARQDVINQARATVHDYNRDTLYDPYAPVKFVREKNQAQVDGWKLQLELMESADSKLNRKYTVIAMNTGRTVYASGAVKLAVWDCGQPVR